MAAEYITLKMDLVVKRQDILKNMKKLGLKTDRKNEKKYVEALKRKRLIANKDFSELENDKEVLLMYGLELES